MGQKKMLWRKLPEDLAKVGVEGSNPFARSKNRLPGTGQRAADTPWGKP
jgi:hypothetical protein